MLVDNGVRSEVVTAVDGNTIDYLVTAFRPDVCIIEALWCTPEKIIELGLLHPKVEFVVRLHSETPFLAHEGIAIEWIDGYYDNYGPSVACNSTRLRRDIHYATGNEPLYLPNYYHPGENFKNHVCNPTPASLQVSCFGAIRPLKNQLLQAICAIKFADDKDLVLNFNINGTRVENSGAGVLKNLRALFSGTRHKLVEHVWYSHTDFLKVLDTMDIGMQASLSETYNIVSADMVSVGLPIVVSDEVNWCSPISRVSAVDSKSIVEGLHRVLLNGRDVAFKNAKALKNNAKQAEKVWMEYVK
jgi:hypothetical protein